MIKHKPWFWTNAKSMLRETGEYRQVGFVFRDLRFVANQKVGFRVNMPGSSKQWHIVK